MALKSLSLLAKCLQTAVLRFLGPEMIDVPGMQISKYAAGSELSGVTAKRVRIGLSENRLWLSKSLLDKLLRPLRPLSCLAAKPRSDTQWSGTRVVSPNKANAL